MLKRCIAFMGVLSGVLLLSAPFHAEQGAAGQVLSASSGQAGGRGGGGQAGGAGPVQAIEQRTAGMQKIDGYFPLYWDERTGSIFIEIPRFNTDFLFSTGLAAGLGSNDIGLDRGAGGGGRLVFFERVGPRVLLVQPNQSF